MSAGLQSKVQMLGILLSVFTLLSVPLFFQVKADAGDDKDSVKTTWGNQFFREMIRNFKDAPDAEVEDADAAWADYLEETGQNCEGNDAACDPTGDLDGDGVSNRDELKAGTNPNCNEDVEGKEVCEGRDPTEDPPANVSALNDVLYSAQGVQSGFQDSFVVNAVTPYYDLWRVEWAVTGYQGFGGFQIIIEDEIGTNVCCESDNVNFPQDNTGEGNQSLVGEDLPGPGNYTIRVESGFAVQGTWDLVVHGVRIARVVD